MNKISVPFEETNNGPSPPHAPSHELLGWLREREINLMREDEH